MGFRLMQDGKLIDPRSIPVDWSEPVDSDWPSLLATEWDDLHDAADWALSVSNALGGSPVDVVAEDGCICARVSIPQSFGVELETA